MHFALLELSSSLLQPLNRFAHRMSQRASNDSAYDSDIDPSQIQIMVRPRLGKVRKLSSSASNSGGSTSQGEGRQLPALRLVSNNTQLKVNVRTRPALRVVVNADESGGGRVVLSGRMADVCAELERLVQQERRLHPCAG